MWYKSLFAAALILVACDVDGDATSTVALSEVEFDPNDVDDAEALDPAESDDPSMAEGGLSDDASAHPGGPLESEQQAVQTAPRGFGCPFNQYKCDSHCASKAGYKGGYCKGLFKQTCKCY